MAQAARANTGSSAAKAAMRGLREAAGMRRSLESGKSKPSWHWDMIATRSDWVGDLLVFCTDKGCARDSAT
ncbi:hypothetical protein CCR91_17100 [Thiorhodovibrio winogradskyi]|nr:hypothetical protein [Thiorhodovibrio winogradskyi]